LNTRAGAQEEQMGFELECASPAGVRCAELAEKHAAEFAATAERYDRENRFPYPHWIQMRQSGLLAAAVPTELGGLGVAAVHDLTVAVNRLARGDGAIAIGVAMHLASFWYLARRYAEPAVADSEAARLRLLLRRCARGHVVCCVAISEHGNPIGRPTTTVEPVPEGYRISGRKAFCTNSPVATLFLTLVRVEDGQGRPRLGFAVVPREAAGLTVADNWDALGMRGSGSGDVVFDGCRLPAGTVAAVGEVGELPAGVLPLVMVAVTALTGAFLGIAEQAQNLVAAALGRRRTPGPAVRTLIGDSEIDLATSRAAVDRVATMLDAALRPAAALADDELTALMAQVQCASMAVKRAAVAVVDRALTASGGGGYLSANPLSRLYRDVRAGPFMQPFSALQAAEYIGRVRLGVTDPEMPQSAEIPR
jgi:alkylation response protein AidB-like acyl-CoA dehydrogenase